jgi:hypothetical protein
VKMTRLIKGPRGGERDWTNEFGGLVGGARVADTEVVGTKWDNEGDGDGTDNVDA